jgi:hypothetical protein
LKASIRLASLRDTGSGGVCAPVVSLRSTTGYRLLSLRDVGERPHLQLFEPDSQMTAKASGKKATKPAKGRKA